MTNGNGGVTAAQENLDRFFTEWEYTQRKLLLDQRNAIAYFVNEMVKEYQKAMVDHIKRFDALRDENAELTRKLEIARREIDHLNQEIEQREFFGKYCNWLDTGNRDTRIAADCGLEMNHDDYMFGWRYPRCPKCGRLINVVVSEVNSK